MRMSDWSSDVCSSDLAGVGPGRHRTHPPRLCARRRPALSLFQLWRRHAHRIAHLPAMTGLNFELLATDGGARRGRLTLNHGVVETQIGSAYCRERVCQDVLISVVDV